jgi:hypothetical protein
MYCTVLQRKDSKNETDKTSYACTVLHSFAALQKEKQALQCKADFLFSGSAGSVSF